jgi:large subunit ribosomal protein L30
MSASKTVEAPKKVKVTLIRSTIGVQEKLIRVVRSLGLRKTNRSVEHYVTPIIAGMLKKVPHLVTVEEVV